MGTTSERGKEKKILKMQLFQTTNMMLRLPQSRKEIKQEIIRKNHVGEYS